MDNFRLISEKRKEIHPIFMGDGPDLKDMKLELENLPVTFTGYLAGEDLSQAYASSDVFTFLSTTDTFGNVVLEAPASGLPVIVTDQEGPRENMIPEKTGYVIWSEDSDAFAAVILNMQDDREHFRWMGLNARL